MINQPVHTHHPEHKQVTFGLRLQSTREAMGIDRKEAALQLRLQEKIIAMLESGEPDPTLPLTFVRGYLRNYSKLLGIPEQDVIAALEWMKPKPMTEEITVPAAPKGDAMPIHIGNIFMQLFTFLLAITVIGLVGIWWHTQHTSDSQTVTLIPAQHTVTHAPVVKATPKQPSPIFSQHDKTILSQMVMGQAPTPLLTNLFLLLIIVTASMRLYGNNIGRTKMASARFTRTPGREQRTYSAPSKAKLAGLLIVGTVLVLFYIGINSWQHKQTTKPQAPAPVARNPIVTAPAPTVADNFQLEMNFEPMDSPNLDALLLASLKVNALQAMVNQIDDYLNQAAAIKFALTDQSTALGQLKHKRKRVRRPAYLYYENNRYY